jgi:hypothetical protein
MLVEINELLTVRDIQHRFRELFPFLKIEFFNKAHKQEKPSAGKDQIVHDKTIGEISSKHKTGTLDIEPTSIVSDIEQAFKTKFGLNIQIFRNMHGTWIQTTGTDNLTLREQNDMGERSQAVIHPDYDERIEDIEPY